MDLFPQIHTKLDQVYDRVYKLVPNFNNSIESSRKSYQNILDMLSHETDEERAIKYLPKLIDSRESLLDFFLKISQNSSIKTTNDPLTTCLLNRTEWLTSSTIDYYLSLIRSPEKMAFPCYFWEDLKNPKTYQQSIRLLHPLLSSCDIFAFPINIDNLHWIALSVDLRRRVIILADSMKSVPEKYLHFINETLRLILNTASLFAINIDFTSSWEVLVANQRFKLEEFADSKYTLSALKWKHEFELSDDEELSCEEISSSGGYATFSAVEPSYISDLAKYKQKLPFSDLSVMTQLDNGTYLASTAMLLQQQYNTYDCGVFTCSFITSILNDWPQYCSTDSCSVIREAMAKQIVRKSFN